jgi:hypothetical protein
MSAHSRQLPAKLKGEEKRWWAAQSAANQSLLPISLIGGNLQGNFAFSPETDGLRPAKASAYQGIKHQFPYSIEQGMYFAEQGKLDG